jgi:hypothetical protein
MDRFVIFWSMPNEENPATRKVSSASLHRQESTAHAYLEHRFALLPSSADINDYEMPLDGWDTEITALKVAIPEGGRIEKLIAFGGTALLVHGTLHLHTTGTNVMRAALDELGTLTSYPGKTFIHEGFTLNAGPALEPFVHPEQEHDEAVHPAPVTSSRPKPTD